MVAVAIDFSRAVERSHVDFDGAAFTRRAKDAHDRLDSGRVATLCGGDDRLDDVLCVALDELFAEDRHLVTGTLRFAAFVDLRVALDEGFAASLFWGENYSRSGLDSRVRERFNKFAGKRFVYSRFIFMRHVYGLSVVSQV